MTGEDMTEAAALQLQELLDGRPSTEFANNWEYFNHLRQRDITLCADKKSARTWLRQDRNIANEARRILAQLRDGFIHSLDGKNAEIRDAQLRELVRGAAKGYGEANPETDIEATAKSIAKSEDQIEDYREALTRVRLEMRMVIADTENKERIYD